MFWSAVLYDVDDGLDRGDRDLLHVEPVSRRRASRPRAGRSRGTTGCARAASVGGHRAARRRSVDFLALFALAIAVPLFVSARLAFGGASPTNCSGNDFDAELARATSSSWFTAWSDGVMAVDRAGRASAEEASRERGRRCEGRAGPEAVTRSGAARATGRGLGGALALGLRRAARPVGAHALARPFAPPRSSAAAGAGILSPSATAAPRA
jgi:hypothetical protein